MQSLDWLRNLEIGTNVKIGTQSQDSENVQRNLEITQILDISYRIQAHTIIIGSSGGKHYHGKRIYLFNVDLTQVCSCLIIPNVLQPQTHWSNRHWSHSSGQSTGT